MSLEQFEGPLVAQQNQCFEETKKNSDYQAESTVFFSSEDLQEYASLPTFLHL